jgi:hypothetical protein
MSTGLPLNPIIDKAALLAPATATARTIRKSQRLFSKRF